jgi:hypothetical protein
MEDKMKKSILILSLFAILTPSIKAQTFYVGIGGGFSTMNPVEYHGFTYQNDITTWLGEFEEIKGQKNDKGLNLRGSIKYDINILPVNIIAGIGYTKYTGKADYVKATVPPWYSTMYYIGEYESKTDLLSINTGIQYEVIHSFVTPYVTLQAMMNRFGETTLEMKNSGNVYEEVKFEKRTRYGLSIGGGLDITIIPKIDTNLEINYVLHNLIGKENGENSINSFNINLIFFH